MSERPDSVPGTPGTPSTPVADRLERLMAQRGDLLSGRPHPEVVPIPATPVSAPALERPVHPTRFAGGPAPRRARAEVEQLKAMVARSAAGPRAPAEHVDARQRAFRDPAEHVDARQRAFRSPAEHVDAGKRPPDDSETSNRAQSAPLDDSDKSKRPPNDPPDDSDKSKRGQNDPPDDSDKSKRAQNALFDAVERAKRPPTPPPDLSEKSKEPPNALPDYSEKSGGPLSTDDSEKSGGPPTTDDSEKSGGPPSTDDSEKSKAPPSTDDSEKSKGAPPAPAGRAQGLVTDRLNLLMRSVGGLPPAAPAGPRVVLPLDGQVCPTPHGPCFVLRDILAPPTIHGDRPVGALLRRAAPDAALLARDALLAGFDPRSALFLDLETTALAPGLGNLPFLIGIAWFQGERLVVEQWLLRDPDEEEAALSQVSQRLEEAEWLVTFNGRTFDWPLLAGRFALHHMTPPPHLGHLDLLPASRRLLRHGLPNCRLGTIEAHHLGLQRVGDVKGSQVPAAWLEYQHGGAPHGLVGVAKHNRDDILSLVTLLDFLLAHTAEAESLVLRDPPLALAIAAAALGLDQWARAEAIYTVATAFPATAEAGRIGLARVARRRKRVTAGRKTTA